MLYMKTTCPKILVAIRVLLFLFSVLVVLLLSYTAEAASSASPSANAQMESLERQVKAGEYIRPLCSIRLDDGMAIGKGMNDNSYPATNGTVGIVTFIQTSLKDNGYLNGKVTGNVDKSTIEAVRALQRDEKITVSGNIDPLTFDRIRSQICYSENTVRPHFTKLSGTQKKKSYRIVFTGDNLDVLTEIGFSGDKIGTGALIIEKQTKNKITARVPEEFLQESVTDRISFAYGTGKYGDSEWDGVGNVSSLDVKYQKDTKAIQVSASFNFQDQNGYRVSLSGYNLNLVKTVYFEGKNLPKDSAKIIIQKEGRLDLLIPDSALEPSYSNLVTITLVDKKKKEVISQAPVYVFYTSREER